MGDRTGITYYQLPIAKLIFRLHPDRITDISVIMDLNPLQITRMREYAVLMTLSHLTEKLFYLAWIENF